VKRALALAALLAVLAAPAAAHNRSTSYSTWELEGRSARVRFRVPQLELTRLPWGVVAPPALAPDLGRYLTQSLRLESDGRACPVVDGPRALASPRDRALVEWRVACPPGGPLAIESDFLAEQAPSHLHFARVRSTGAPAVERVLSSAEPRWPLPQADGVAAAPAGSTLGSYLLLGVEHIATGYDHLVFLLGLLLLARALGEVVTIVTGFTVAHSITLGLAAVGRVHPEPAAVEALIGLSIALVAAENGWLLSGRGRAVPAAVTALLVGAAGLALAGAGAIPASTLLGLALFSACYFAAASRSGRPVRLRAAIAFCFGLVHGFGFAGVLAEFALPQGRLLPALLGFNLGVEAGQLAIVAVVWPALRGLARLREGAAQRWVVEAGTALVCALGVYWLVERAYT
jgi:hypothetical protein